MGICRLGDLLAHQQGAEPGAVAAGRHLLDQIQAIEHQVARSDAARHLLTQMLLQVAPGATEHGQLGQTGDQVGAAGDRERRPVGPELTPLADRAGRALQHPGLAVDDHQGAQAREVDEIARQRAHALAGVQRRAHRRHAGPGEGQIRRAEVTELVRDERIELTTAQGAQLQRREVERFTGRQDLAILQPDRRGADPGPGLQPHDDARRRPDFERGSDASDARDERRETCRVGDHPEDLQGRDFARPARLGHREDPHDDSRQQEQVAVDRARERRGREQRNPGPAALRTPCRHRTPARPRTPVSSPAPRGCAPAPCSRHSRRPRRP